MIHVPGEEIQGRLAFAAMLDQGSADVAVVAGQRRAADFRFGIGTENCLGGVRVVGHVIRGLE